MVSSISFYYSVRFCNVTTTSYYSKCIYYPSVLSEHIFTTDLQPLGAYISFMRYTCFHLIKGCGTLFGPRDICCEFCTSVAVHLQRLYERSCIQYTKSGKKRKRNSPIYSNTNYCREMNRPTWIIVYFNLMS